MEVAELLLFLLLQTAMLAPENVQKISVECSGDEESTGAKNIVKWSVVSRATTTALCVTTLQTSLSLFAIISNWPLNLLF